MTDLADFKLSRVTQIAQDLIRFDTSNFGSGKANGEAEAADYTSAILEKLDLAPIRVESAPKRSNLVSRVIGKNPELPALVVHGHLDVVPAIAEEWTVDPFGGIVNEGYLWGRGAVDMKNMNAMILHALELLNESGEQPERDLIVAFFADEEAGGLFGSHYLVDNHPELFAGAGTAISEVGGYSVTINDHRRYLIQTGEKAMLWLNLEAKGKAGHGSQINSDNAISKLAAAISRIVSADWPIQLTQTTEQLLVELQQIFELKSANLTEIFEKLGPISAFIAPTFQTTVNPTGLSSGYKHNVVPATATATLDVRPLPGEEEAVLEKLQALAGEEVKVTISHRDIGLENSFDDPLITAMTNSLRQEDPEAKVAPYLLSGGTDNKALSKLGIKGYGFAPLKLPADFDFAAMFHGVDERVPLEALEFGSRVLLDLFKKY